MKVSIGKIDYHIDYYYILVKLIRFIISLVLSTFLLKIFSAKIYSQEHQEQNNPTQNQLISSPSPDQLIITRLGHHFLISSSLQNSQTTINHRSSTDDYQTTKNDNPWNIINHAFSYSFHISLFNLSLLNYFVGTKIEVSYPLFDKALKISLPFSFSIPSIWIGIKATTLKNNQLWASIDYSLRSMNYLFVKSKINQNKAKNNQWEKYSIYADDLEIACNWIKFFNNYHGISLGWSIEWIRWKPYPFIDSSSNVSLDKFEYLQKSHKITIGYIRYMQ